MSSPYQMLDNRPIDQWKVTELKEELKKRRLTISGLKQDLVKRLDEAVRIEREDAQKKLENAQKVEENDQKEVENGLSSDPEPVVMVKSSELQAVIAETNEGNLADSGKKTGNMDSAPLQVDINCSVAAPDQVNIQEEYMQVDKDSATIEEEIVVETTTVETTTVETSVTVVETVISDVTLSEEDENTKSYEHGSSKPHLENEESELLMDAEDSKPLMDIEVSNPQFENESSRPQLESDTAKPKPHLENEESEALMDAEDSKPLMDIEASNPQFENESSRPQLERETAKPQLESDTTKPQLESDTTKPQLESDTTKPQLESDTAKPQLESDTAKLQLDNEMSRPTPEEVVVSHPASNNQVSEVRPVLGSQVKYDSISTDSLSINEKIELKDIIIADHVKLELDVIKPEMVEPPPSTVVLDCGSHPMDVEEPSEHKASMEEKDDKNGTSADLGKKNDNVDVGYSEKLNLDRSSGDDSMEEDILENKQIDSKYSSDDVGDRSEKTEVHVGKDEETYVDVVGGDFSVDKKDVQVENKDPSFAPAEKRKLNDQSLVGNSEPLKRQRRWASESLKVPEPQGSNYTATTTPKDTFPSVAKRNFSRSDSTVSEDASKERLVPPSPKPPTSSLRIDRFLRPFTLKAVQELLGKNGKVTDFWMDHIKTHCYVTYSSVEEAIETRNAVYNLQWPPNGGRFLVAEFVDPQEVKAHLETPQTATASVNTAPVPQTPPTQPSPRQPRQQQQQLPPPSSLPPPPPLSNPPPVRERLPPPPPLPEKVDPPIVTLDDLFRKTKATPRIYYLPLSEEQVAAKLAVQGKNTRQ